MGSVDRGLIRLPGSQCPMSSGRYLSIRRSTDDAITRLHPRKSCVSLKSCFLVRSEGRFSVPTGFDGEKEAQRRGLCIHLRWLRTLLDLCQLETADIVAARGIGGAAEKSGKGLDMPDIVVLCLVAKAPDRHVRDHAAAKIADRLVAHRRLLS